MAIASTNPATGEVLAEFDELGEGELARRLERSAEAFVRFRQVPLGERARRMSRAAEILEARQRDLGRLMTLEMGKPIEAAAAEAAKCALACRYYAENAGALLADERVPTDARESWIRYEPATWVFSSTPRTSRSAPSPSRKYFAKPVSTTTNSRRSWSARTRSSGSSMIRACAPPP